MLCGDCETQFSVYEKYAKGVLFGGEKIEILVNTTQGFEWRVDYDCFKRFELSILWRMGISTLPEFKDIVLGSHERRIRRMLRKEYPGETEEYGCILIWPISHRNIVDGLIMPMGMVKIDGVQCCKVILAGMCWLFFISQQAMHEKQKGLFLQNDGSLRIIRGNFCIDKYIQDLSKSLHANNPHLFCWD